MIKGRVVPVSHKLFQKIGKKGIFSQSFNEASIRSILKPNKDSKEKENFRPVSNVN